MNKSLIFYMPDVSEDFKLKQGKVCRLFKPKNKRGFVVPLKP